MWRAFAISSARNPSPDPSTIATRGLALPSRARTASVASRITGPRSPVPRPQLSDQHPRDRRAHEGGQIPRDHGAQTEAGEIAAAVRGEPPDPADLDRER